METDQNNGLTRAKDTSEPTEIIYCTLRDTTDHIMTENKRIQARENAKINR